MKKVFSLNIGMFSDNIHLVKYSVNKIDQTTEDDLHQYSIILRV